MSQAPLAPTDSPTIIVAPDGTVHLRIHATTLHLRGGEFIELVGKAVEALASVTKISRAQRFGGLQ